MYLFFMLSVVTSFNYFINHCGAQCSYTVEDNTIDLSELSLSTLDGSDGTFDFYYTPCEDGLICTESTGVQWVAMADQLNSAGNCAAYLATWDDNIQPTYSYLDQSFTFEYSNGEISQSCTSYRKFRVVWKCDPNTTASVESVSEIGTCEYEMIIQSSLACNGGTNNNTCVWVTTNNEILDLTSFEGVMIEYSKNSIFHNNNTVEFIYTPCRNGLICMDQTNQIYDINVMSMELNENGICEAYLAKWDRTVLPIYDSSKQSFTFTYQNGEIDDECINGRTLYVEWKCSEDENKLFEVETAGEMVSCVYEIIIKSKLICIK